MTGKVTMITSTLRQTQKIMIIVIRKYIIFIFLYVTLKIFEKDL